MPLSAPLPPARWGSRVPGNGYANYNPAMSEERKKPGVGICVTVAISIALLYPISFGPACWLAARRDTPAGVRRGDYDREMLFFWPLNHAVTRDDIPWTIAPLKWWAALGIRHGYVLVLPTDAEAAGACQWYF
jgi:hypothetical protein